MADYINNKIFYNRLKEYRKTGSKKIYELIGKDFLLIAKNFLNRPLYINRSEDRKNEMISDATYYMCKYIDKFDLSRLNAFAYFTMIVKNAFLQNIQDYNKRDEMFTSIEFIDSADTKENLL